MQGGGWGLLGGGLWKSYEVLSGFFRAQQPEEIPHPDTFKLRNPLLTVITFGLLGYKPTGTKIEFIPNSIDLQDPTVMSKASRTFNYYFDPRKGTGKEYLTQLREDFQVSLEWYPPGNEGNEYLKPIYLAAKRGLDSLSKTYAGSLVEEFTSNCNALIDLGLSGPKDPVEPQKPLSQKIKNLVGKDDATIISGLFERMRNEQRDVDPNVEIRCRASIEAVESLRDGKIAILQELISIHLKHELTL